MKKIITDLLLRASAFINGRETEKHAPMTKEPNNTQARKTVAVAVKKLHEDAVIPKYAKPDDAGFDLVAVEDVEIKAGETVLIPTGLAFGIPSGYEIQVRPRSGLSLKTKFRIPNSPATIDAGYIGELCIIAENTGEHTFSVSKGDRIAQGIIKEVPKADFFEVDELEATERGAGGFGSTGVNSDA